MAHCILCGIDESEEAAGAARFAAQLSEQLELRLVLVHVAHPRVAITVPATLAPPAMPTPDEAFAKDGEPGRTELLEQLASREGIEGKLRTEVGDPAERILAVAEAERASLIVVGSRGRGPFASLFLGSVSAAVASRSNRPVVIVPAGAGLLSLQAPAAAQSA